MLKFLFPVISVFCRSCAYCFAFCKSCTYIVGVKISGRAMFLSATKFQACQRLKQPTLDLHGSYQKRTFMRHRRVQNSRLNVNVQQMFKQFSSPLIKILLLGTAPEVKLAGTYLTYLIILQAAQYGNFTVKSDVWSYGILVGSWCNYVFTELNENLNEQFRHGIFRILHKNTAKFLICSISRVLGSRAGVLGPAPSS